MSPFPSLVTVSALILYFVVTINVGRARVKYQVPVPKTTGNLDFERVLRVQQNTLEQLVVFLPALWLFSVYVSPIWGSVLGATWIIGRIAYAWGYYQAAEKRVIGFAISSLSGVGLILGSLVGIILSLMKA
ncbi:MAPEG family protein [Anabaena sp. PCC 7108]|uniref:MAPEG family protein n=1 Tax=Anabaena sp. PCC 7108 TaxID=163908 RepID=UPI00034DB721|nr:MAPEG family protein [Anabaena sp. PCC 7108]